MRIGIDARFLESKRKTGVAFYLENLINGLARIDKKNEYILYFNSLMRKEREFPGPEQDNFRKRIIRLPYFSSIHFNMVWSILIAREMSRDRVDVGHLMNSSFPCKIGFKSIVTIHDMISYRYPALQNADIGRFNSLKTMLERSIHKSNSIIAVSENTKLDLVEYFPSSKNKIKVVPLGCSYRKSDISITDLKRIKKKYSLGKNNILVVGTLDKRKNIEIVLEALKKLINEHNFNHKLIIIGKNGTAANSINDTIKTLNMRDRVILLGYVDEAEMPYFYRVADLLIFPSIYEGFGLPCLEGMSSGVPLILSDIAIFREIVGDAGVFFNPNNVNELSRAILLITSSTEIRGEMIKKGFERVKNFTWEKTASQTLEAYGALYKSNN